MVNGRVDGSCRSKLSNCFCILPSLTPFEALPTCVVGSLGSMLMSLMSAMGSLSMFFILRNAMLRLSSVVSRVSPSTSEYRKSRISPTYSKYRCDRFDGPTTSLSNSHGFCHTSCIFLPLVAADDVI